MSLLDYSVKNGKLNKAPQIEINNKIRLIELFAGVGSQSMAMKRLGVDFENYKISEWDYNAIKSYKAIHHSTDNTDYSSGKTVDELINYFCKYGMSLDGKDPITREQLIRKGENWLRTAYNDYKATHNIGSIVCAHANDLEIVDKDNYTYMMFYSFPCTDLSLAGQRQGMSKGSGTRSGLLWEVERLLQECGDNLPQILFMENVPQVHSSENLSDFQDWMGFLRSIGYKNFLQDLNGKDYGVAQNRERAFMLSILGNYTYTFPKPIELSTVMEDYLDEEVDEKYYVHSQKAEELIVRLQNEGIEL